MAKRSRAEEIRNEEEEEEVPEIVRLRRKNMERNAFMMAALGVGQSQRRRPAPVKREKPRPQEEPLPLRRSSRSKKGAAADRSEDLYALPGTWTAKQSGRPRRMKEAQRIKELYGPERSEPEAADFKKALNAQLSARDEGTAGTASYEHCLHRVSTMSDAALARRVKAIERARGKASKEKMLVFSQVLRLKGNVELCARAEAALDRLVRGVPMPTDDTLHIDIDTPAEHPMGEDSAAIVIPSEPLVVDSSASSPGMAAVAAENDQHGGVLRSTNPDANTHSFAATSVTSATKPLQVEAKRMEGTESTAAPTP